MAFVWAFITNQEERPASEPTNPVAQVYKSSVPRVLRRNRGFNERTAVSVEKTLDGVDGNNDVPDLIRKLDELMEVGVLTKEEFQTKKAELLSEIGNSQNSGPLVLPELILDKQT